MTVRLVDGKLEGLDPEMLAAASDPVEASSEPQCEVCGYAIEYAGRGRKPKYHPHCRPNSSGSNGSRNPTGGNAKKLRNEDAIREALLIRYTQVAQVLSMLHPLTAQQIRNNAEVAVEADIELARVSPKFRKAIEGSLEKTAAGVVIAVHASMLSPLIAEMVGKRARKKMMQAAQSQGKATPGPTVPRPKSEPARESARETVNAGAMPGMPG